MVAERRIDRKRALLQRLGDAAVTLDIALVDEIASHEQQIGPVAAMDELGQHQIEALAVELVRIIRLEAQMDGCDLRDQHNPLPRLYRAATPPAATVVGSPRMRAR